MAYLVLRNGCPVAREVLASMLWSDVTTTQSKTYLRKALYRLRSTLEKAGPRCSDDVIHGDADWLQFDVPDWMWVDVVECQNAISNALDGEGELIEKKAALEAAASHYVGELLEGWYHKWCLYERERIHQRFVGSLYQLVTMCEAAGEIGKSVTYGLQLVRHAPYSERAHRALIRAHYLAGDRGGAIRQFRRCEQMLRDELGVPPAEETSNLLSMIRRGELVPSQKADSDTNPPRASVRSAVLEPDISLGRLRRMEQVLEHLRAELHATVERLERNDQI